MSQGFAVGDMLTIDRGFAAAVIPPELAGGDLIRSTSDVSKLPATATTLCTLTLAREATVWISWPSEGPVSQRTPGSDWTATKLTLTWTYDPAQTLSDDRLTTSEQRRTDRLWQRTGKTTERIAIPLGARCVAARGTEEK